MSDLINSVLNIFSNYDSAALLISILSFVISLFVASTT